MRAFIGICLLRTGTMAGKKNQTKPNHTELAQMKVMSDLGHSPTWISRQLHRSHHTIVKYLNSDVYQDPEIHEIVKILREKELADLTLLNTKARERLHELIDEGDSSMIPTIALMDRTFQQRQLLERKPLETMSFQDLALHFQEKAKELSERVAELDESIKQDEENGEIIEAGPAGDGSSTIDPEPHND